MIQYLLVIGIIILLLVFGWIYDFSINMIKQSFQKHPDSLLILLSLLGYMCINLFSKCKRQQEGLEAQQTGLNENIEKLQENIVVPQKESSVTVQEIKDKSHIKKDYDVEKIFEYMYKGKYELAISQTQKKLTKVKSEKKEFLYRFILYYAYMDCSNDQFINDVIDNLIKFIALSKKYGNEEIYWEARYNLMVAYAKQKKFDDIIKENRSYIKEIEKNSKISADIKFRCYKMQAFIYLKENNIPFAMGYFDEALKYSDNDFDILYNMALTYYYLNNDVDKCLECLNRIDVTHISDNDEQYRLFVIMQYYCLSLKKDYFSAYKIINNYQHSIKNLPSKMKGHKAYIAYKVDKFDEAKTLSNEVLSSIPDTTSTNVRGMLFLREKKYQEAYDNFKSIISEFTDENKYFLGEIYYHCSYACLELNRIKEAVDYFNKAQKIGYNDFDSNYIVNLDIAQHECFQNKKEDDHKKGNL